MNACSTNADAELVRRCQELARAWLSEARAIQHFQSLPAGHCALPVAEEERTREARAAVVVAARQLVFEEDRRDGLDLALAGVSVTFAEVPDPEVVARVVEAVRAAVSTPKSTPGEPWTPPSIDEVVGAVAAYFHTHGGSTAGALNPLTSASGPPVFAAGVDVRKVVEAVIGAVRGPGAAA